MLLLHQGKGVKRPQAGPAINPAAAARSNVAAPPAAAAVVDYLLCGRRKEHPQLPGADLLALLPLLLLQLLQGPLPPDSGVPHGASAAAAAAAAVTAAAAPAAAPAGTGKPLGILRQAVEL